MVNSIEFYVPHYYNGRQARGLQKPSNNKHNGSQHNHDGSEEENILQRQVKMQLILSIV